MLIGNLNQFNNLLKKKMFLANVSFFLVLIIASSVTSFTEAAKRCPDCTNAVKKLLNDPYFDRKVYQSFEKIQDPQAGCRSQDPFSYFDFTAGRCHKCKDLCNNEASVTECIKVCQPYLIHLNYSFQFDELKQELKNKDEIISQLRGNNIVIYLMLVFLFVMLIALHLWQFVHNRNTYQTLRIASPVGDRQSTPQQVKSHDDAESAYVSIVSMNSVDQ